MQVNVNISIVADFFEMDDEYVKERKAEGLSLDEIVSEYFEDAISRIEGCVDNHFPGGLKNFEINVDLYPYPN
jgi:hypothetical protein